MSTTAQCTEKSIKDQVREQRGGRYGPIFHSHHTIGLAIQSVLESWLGIKIPTIPPRIIALILAAMKLSRMARPFQYDKDDHTDLSNYVDFADEMDERNPNFDVQKHLSTPFVAIEGGTVARWKPPVIPG